MIRQEIIKQYISSLKEDNELDFIFPILLERMGFRILSTPKQSKGMSQYGRDVVAVKKKDGVPTLFLFELKGFAAKDITDRNLSGPDGLIESLRASKYTLYEDESIPDLKNYHREYVFVHNGTVDLNALPTLNGFIKQEFPEGNFKRWDIEKLTSLFSNYLFDETIIADDESYRLFKKCLVLLDAEENDYSDISKLVELQVRKLEKAPKNSKRLLLNCFATLRLIVSMVYFYSKDSNNLFPAKYCIDTVVLKIWAWILREKKENTKSVLKLFNGLLIQQIMIYEEYVNKILKIAHVKKSLYSFQPSLTEQVFYPLRCYDFLGDLIYFYLLTDAFQDRESNFDGIRMDALKAIIRNNPACTVPLLDTHSIPILMVFRYMAFRIKEHDDSNSLVAFITDSIFNLMLRYKQSKMWPEMTGNRMALAKSLFSKSEEYVCESSLLILNLFEIIAYMNLNDLYSVFKKLVDESNVNLQVAYPETKEYDIEQCLFEHRLNEELSVETNIQLPPTLEEFCEKFRKKYNSIKYRTYSAGYDFLRTLAHKYYDTDFFPDYLGRQFCIDL